MEHGAKGTMVSKKKKTTKTDLSEQNVAEMIGIFFSD